MSSNAYYIQIKYHICSEPFNFNLNKSVNQYIQSIRTLEYCSPQLKIAKESWGLGTTFKSDVFSLGILFYFIITTKSESADNILSLESQDNQHDPTIQNIFSMISKDPAKRPQLSEVKLNITVSSSRSPSRLIRPSSINTTNLLSAGSADNSEIDRSTKGSPLIKRSPSQHSSASYGFLSVPSKHDRQDVESRRGPIESSQPSANSFINIMRTISKQRNKYLFLTVVANTIYTLGINQFSIKLALLLLKKAKIKSMHLVVLANKQKLLRSAGDDFGELAKIISSEEIEISNSYKALKSIIKQKERKLIMVDKAFDLELNDDHAINEKYLRNIVKEYIKGSMSKVSNKIHFYLSSSEILMQLQDIKDESKTTKKLLLHLHNTADAENIDNFFADFISDCVIRLEEQVYFTELETYDSVTLYKYLGQKGY